MNENTEQGKKTTDQEKVLVIVCFVIAGIMLLSFISRFFH